MSIQELYDFARNHLLLDSSVEEVLAIYDILNKPKPIKETKEINNTINNSDVVDEVVSLLGSKHYSYEETLELFRV